MPHDHEHVRKVFHEFSADHDRAGLLVKIKVAVGKAQPSLVYEYSIFAADPVVLVNIKTAQWST